MGGIPSLGGPPPWKSPRSTEAIEKSVAQPARVTRRSARFGASVPVPPGPVDGSLDPGTAARGDADPAEVEQAAATSPVVMRSATVRGSDMIPAYAACPAMLWGGLRRGCPTVMAWRRSIAG